MSADTLVADGAAVTLAPPAPVTIGSTTTSYVETSFAVMGTNHDEIAVASYAGTPKAGVAVSGYSLDGTLVFNDTIDQPAGSPSDSVSTPQLATSGQAGVIVTYASSSAWGPSQVYAAGIGTDGSILSEGPIDWHSSSVDPHIFSAPSGAVVEMDTTFYSDAGPPQGPYDNLASLLPRGSLSTFSARSSAQEVAFADIALNGSEFVIVDNQALLGSHLVGTVPGEPASAMTQAVAAALANGTSAAVAWVDSGTDYVSIFDSATKSFGPTIGLDWGGASDLHVVALNDGGFAVSWMNGGAYKGELFDANGNGGGVISLAGDVAGIASNGDLYTVGFNSSGQYVVQQYALGHPGGSTGGGTAGGGGSGGTTGQTFTSDNNGDTWVGTSGDDTFHLGRGGDHVTGNGGNDTYAFAEIPWAGGHITDFNAGDVLDLTGLASTTGDTGTDGFADGYLKITDSTSGAQVWAQYAASGSGSGWWLVETLNGVSASSLSHTGDVITVAPPAPTSVSTSDSHYIVPASVTSLTLTGSNQTVTAYYHQDLTIWSDNGANTIQSGSGDDTIHIGRGGDTVWGDGGRDTFVFDETPWAPATIKDFDYSAGDSIDVRGLLVKAGYTGSDPIADGYLRIQNGEIDANYHQPGNDGWWVVVKGAYAPGGVVYNDGVIHGANYVGGTYTTSGSWNDGGGLGRGYETIITTGSNGGLTANDGGDTLIDQGTNNTLGDGRGNDTLILSPTTKEVYTGWGGLDTIVLAAHPQVATWDPEDLNPGARIDVHQLLQGMGYTGSDPIGDGYLQVYRQPQDFGQMAPNALQIRADFDGPGGAGTWTTVFWANGFSVNPHYSDGYFVF